MHIKPIPGTLGFYASRDGRIVGPDHRTQNQYTNGDGYKTASVKLEGKGWRTFGVHRLVALAHLPLDGDPDQFAVNHIDHDRKNNRVSNLEWTTDALNAMHASMMRLDVLYPTLILTDRDGESGLINNLHDAANLLEIDVSLAWELVKSGERYAGSTLKPYLKGTALPKALRSPTIPRRGADGRPEIVQVRVFDYALSQETVFDSMAEAARHYETSTSHIFQCISSEGRPRLFQRRYLIVRGTDAFPVIPPDKLAVLMNASGRITHAWNEQTGVISSYTSAAKMVKAFGLSKKAATVRLKRDGYGQIGPIHFAYAEHQDKLWHRAQQGSSPA